MKKPKTFTRADAADMWNHLVSKGVPKNSIPKTFGELWDMSTAHGFTPGPEFGTIPGEKNQSVPMHFWVAISILVSLFLIYFFNL